VSAKLENETVNEFIWYACISALVLSY